MNNCTKLNKLKRNMVYPSLILLGKGNESLTPMISTPLNKVLNLQKVMTSGEPSTQ